MEAKVSKPKNKSAYNLWSEGARKTVKEEHPGIKVPTLHRRARMLVPSHSPHARLPHHLDRTVHRCRLPRHPGARVEETRQKVILYNNVQVKSPHPVTLNPMCSRRRCRLSCLTCGRSWMRRRRPSGRQRPPAPERPPPAPTSTPTSRPRFHARARTSPRLYALCVGILACASVCALATWPTLCADNGARLQPGPTKTEATSDLSVGRRLRRRRAPSASVWCRRRKRRTPMRTR